MDVLHFLYLKHKFFVKPSTKLFIYTQENLQYAISFGIYYDTFIYYLKNWSLDKLINRSVFLSFKKNLCTYFYFKTKTTLRELVL